ncbi:hypothetical protein [Paraflavitalea speifideaquila]|uniref:hypothetical protein n=1 Tax=Paraflavitalea speifideaquila TaxID=3076558 RepID=UPI0028F011ED|nr:hypothetical protein [Paraflavitalea speifideiaquila]
MNIPAGSRYFSLLSGNMKLASYTKKDWVIIGLLLPPVIVLVNYCVFGQRYFPGPGIFWWPTLLSGGWGLISWYLQNIIALLMRARYPRYHQTIRRVLISMGLYVLMTIVTVAMIFLLYDRVGFFNMS